MCGAMLKLLLPDVESQRLLRRTDGALVVDHPHPITVAVATGQIANTSIAHSSQIDVSCAIRLMTHFNETYRGIIPPQDPEGKAQTSMWTAYRQRIWATRFGYPPQIDPFPH